MYTSLCSTIDFMIFYANMHITFHGTKKNVKDLNGCFFFEKTNEYFCC